MDGFASIPSKRTLRVIAVISGVLTVALWLKLWAIDQGLSPFSIIEYEFAWSAERAKEMFTAWEKSAGLEAARDSLRYDFPFLLENVALWRALEQPKQPPELLLHFAALMAGVKFLLLVASALYVMFLQTGGRRD